MAVQNAMMEFDFDSGTIPETIYGAPQGDSIKCNKRPPAKVISDRSHPAATVGQDANC
jgi:hypothetical protein